jgi:hypothetical protein
MSGQPIIRVELLGGLGNQLFQAAAGYALARRLGAALQFDISRFRAKGSRAFALEGLAHGGTVVEAGAGQRLAARALRRLSFGRAVAPPGWTGSAFREAGYAYDPRIEAITGSCYLRGYFHSEKYFKEFEVDLRKALDLAPRVSETARALAASMPERSLAVHLRIGDFSQRQFSAVHGTLSPRYYRDAIALACDARGIERIYVFTDTPDAIPSLMPEGVAYEAVTGNPAHDDLWLMSQSRHHIIANSTFSWWSAWLDDRPGKLVIAPSAWLAPDALKKTYIGDLYPEGWVML